MASCACRSANCHFITHSLAFDVDLIDLVNKKSLSEDAVL
jgi:hypothetical protein